jgi:hypothetical protein
MMNLSKERLEQLEEIWGDFPDGLEISDFTKLIVESIDCTE